MNNNGTTGAEERRLQRLLQAERLSPDGARLEIVRRSVLARVPAKGSGNKLRLFSWFSPLVGIGALALALIAIGLQTHDPGQGPPRVALEHIGEAAADDVALAQLVDLLAGFTGEEEEGTATGNDLLGLDPLGWNGGDDGPAVL